MRKVVFVLVILCASCSLSGATLQRGQKIPLDICVKCKTVKDLLAFEKAKCSKEIFPTCEEKVKYFFKDLYSSLVSVPCDKRTEKAFANYYTQGFGGLRYYFFQRQMQDDYFDYIAVYGIQDSTKHTNEVSYNLGDIVVNKFFIIPRNQSVYDSLNPLSGFKKKITMQDYISTLEYYLEGISLVFDPSIKAVQLPTGPVRIYEPYLIEDSTLVLYDQLTSYNYNWGCYKGVSVSLTAATVFPLLQYYINPAIPDKYYVERGEGESNESYSKRTTPYYRFRPEDLSIEIRIWHGENRIRADWGRWNESLIDTTIKNCLRE